MPEFLRIPELEQKIDSSMVTANGIALSAVQMASNIILPVLSGSLNLLQQFVPLVAGLVVAPQHYDIVGMAHFE